MKREENGCRLEYDDQYETEFPSTMSVYPLEGNYDSISINQQLFEMKEMIWIHQNSISPEDSFTMGISENETFVEP